MSEEPDKRFWDEEWDSSSEDSWGEEGARGEEESESELSSLSSDASSSVDEAYEGYGRVRLRKPSYTVGASGV
jgi:hypothetical protein